MDKLKTYVNSLPPSEQEAFATRCRTTIGYLRKAMSIGQKLGESLCINIERESGGAVPCEDLRPDVDWAYLRGTGKDAGLLSQLANLHPGEDQRIGQDTRRHPDCGGRRSTNGHEEVA